ncbi:SdpI family protein [Actinoplanes sp. NPDC051411]|uniref:SdpI family protein n=1 Tax=Actinoplanes sp. NPDC051411 TaxID=3155522 RepID=UPI003412D746
MVGAVVVIVAGALVALTGLLGSIGRLPRNRLAGVRTAATMRSDEAFVAGNRAAGPPIVLGGLVAVAGGVAVLFGAGKPAIIPGVVIMVVLALVGASRANRAALRRSGPL